MVVLENNFSQETNTCQTLSCAFSRILHPHNNLGKVDIEIICSFKGKK